MATQKTTLQTVSSSESLDSTISTLTTSKYNLRNRGPATFAKLADQECPICLSEVYEKPVVTNCGHTFCGKCIRQSMVKFKTCPVCNQILIKELFLNDTSYTRKLTRSNRSPRVAMRKTTGTELASVECSSSDETVTVKKRRMARAGAGRGAVEVSRRTVV